MIIYDTKKHAKVPFHPLEQGKVKLYTCGPTVYADAHIGNYRTYIFEDLLRRTLEYKGYKVTHVMNLTDIDDKTIRISGEKGVALKEFTAPIVDRFFQDIDELKIKRAHHYPAATDHIPEMIDLISKLLATGYAYEADGSIYFSIEKYQDYGKLSGMKLDKLVRGMRIDADEYEKDNFRDFALWRGWSEADGDVKWDAPFGAGRPGWHIECSAMSMKYLGEQFDIHTGGVDNIFPHHENEIAQSVCATGKEFVKYWMHSAHLIFEGEKMSKSLGNVATLRELMDQGYSSRSIRYVLLTTHYRQQINFTDDVIKAAVASLARLDTLRLVAIEATGEGAPRKTILDFIEIAESGFSNGLSDDLNISASMAALFNLVSNLHAYSKELRLTRSEGQLIIDFWQKIDTVLVFFFPSDEFPHYIVDKIKERIKARSEKKWDVSDNIRQELSKLGYQLEDSSQGTTVTGNEGRVFIK